MATEGIAGELQRELDAFMATHAAAATAALALPVLALPPAVAGARDRLTWLATAMATTAAADGVPETTSRLLAWLAGLDGRNAGPSPPSSSTAITSATRSCGSWLIGELLVAILTAAAAANSTTQQPTAQRAVEQLLDRCVVAFQEAFEAEHGPGAAVDGHAGPSGFFAFMSKTPPPTGPSTAEIVLLERVTSQWRRVLGLVALSALQPVTQRLQRQLLPPLLGSKAAGNKEHPILKNLSELRLGLHTTFLLSTTVTQKIKDAAACLRLFQPLLLKPFKTPTRLAALSTVAGMLTRELAELDAKELLAMYTTVHISEWNSTLSELHAIALKLGGKREFLGGAWELRVSVLCLAPTEIFGRYWKEDFHGLLRAQYQQNKDGGGGPHAATILTCVGRMFVHTIRRHFLLERRVPSELDCMEIINTTQAWCFFVYPKHRSLRRLQAQVVPTLIDMSIGIASYNVLYGIQSHLRRLLQEAETIFDEKKLVGLESLYVMLTECDGDPGHDRKRRIPGLTMDVKVLNAHRGVFGGLIGHILIESNAHFGNELLVESTTAVSSSNGPSAPSGAAGRNLKDEYRRGLAIQSYAMALACVPYLYSALELSGDQRLLLLARASIHEEPVVRKSASEALHCLLRREQQHAAEIIRGLTDYLLRLPCHKSGGQDLQACIILIELLTSLLEVMLRQSAEVLTPFWTSRKARDESFVQIEATAVYLLAFEDTIVRKAALSAIQSVAKARNSGLLSGDVLLERWSVYDVLVDTEPDIQEELFAFEETCLQEQLAKDELGFLKHIISDVGAKSSFRWSCCLSIIFPRLALCAPDVTAYIWADVSDKVIKAEPVIPTSVEDPTPHAFELARWRNLALLATATACPNLVFRSGDSECEDSKTNSVESVISSSTVQALFKRFCRFLKSPSMEQKRGVLLALGNTHLSSVPILTEVLMKYEAEAFSTGSESSRHASVGNIAKIPTQGAPIYSSGGDPAIVQRRKQTKDDKGRKVNSALQTHLLWALTRCYRLLLHATRYPIVTDESSREALHRLQLLATAFLDKVAVSFEGSSDEFYDRHSKETSHITFMIQQDFCSSVRILALLHERSSTAFMETSKIASIGKRRSDTCRRTPSIWRQSNTISRKFARFVDPKQRGKWFHILLGWCQSFCTLTSARLGQNVSDIFFLPTSPLREMWLKRGVVIGDRFEDKVLPWHWIDELDTSRPLAVDEAILNSFHHLFLCQSAFSAMSVLMQGPWFVDRPLTADSTALRWIDECFALDPRSAGHSHFSVLQEFAHRSLLGLLRGEFSSCIDVCLDKAYFNHNGGDKHNIAKNYFRVICSVTDELRCELNNAKRANLYIRVLHVTLLHLGNEDDSSHRDMSIRFINTLVHNSATGESSGCQISGQISSSKRSAGILACQLSNRMQAVVSSYLSSRFVEFSQSMVMSMLRFLSYSETAQQRKMLVVVLPWLNQVNLINEVEVSIDNPSEVLLSMLFRLTTNLASTCSDQLEQVWLTLAFSVANTATINVHVQNPKSNLTKILEYLFTQRATTIRINTAKTITWWLCRWQAAAYDVLRELLVIVDERRQHIEQVIPGPLGTVTAGSGALGVIHPIDDAFMLVALLSDSSCNLSTIPPTFYQNPEPQEMMIVQTVHFAFLALFGVISDPDVLRLQAKRDDGDSDGGHRTQDAALHADICGDCFVMLRNLLGQLHGAKDLLESTLNDLERCLAPTFQEEHRDQAIHKRFEQALASFASALPLCDRVVWGHECVKDITLGMVSDANAGIFSSTSSRCNNVQVLRCVRFGLLTYGVLDSTFHGDVFIALMELLHLALDEQSRGARQASFVIRDCLNTLQTIVATMPATKLALYPQILWVCLAMLNHVTENDTCFCALQLLHAIVNKPHFASNRLLQDTLLAKRPSQWTDEQGSILRAVVWNLDTCGGKEAKHLAFDVVSMFVLIPNPVFHKDPYEHLVISTMLLVPFLTADIVSPLDDDEGRLPNVLVVRRDLTYAWEHVGSDAVRDALLRMPCRRGPVDEASIRGFVELFTTAFVAEVSRESPNGEFLTMSLEVLVKIIAGEETQLPLGCCLPVANADPSDPPRLTTRRTHLDLAAVTLWFVEALIRELRQIQSQKAWRPSSGLLASLARLVRDPDQSPRWQAAVRIMAEVSAFRHVGKAPLGTGVTKAKPQLKVSITPPTSLEEMHIHNSTASSSQPESPVPAKNGSRASTPIKRDGTPSGTRNKLLHLMGIRSATPTSATATSSPSNHSNNNNSLGDADKSAPSVAEPASDNSPVGNRREL